MLIVTGASGLLGVTVVLRAFDLGRPVVGLCHHHAIRIPNVPIYSIDLTDRVKVHEMFTLLHPAEIIHCAAATNVDWCEEHLDEANAINERVPSFLSELACEVGAYFLHISTDAVFDGLRSSYTETDEPAPLNVYAKSKLLGEREVLQQNSSAAVARVNIYGWNAQNKLSLAEWVIARLEAGTPVPGFTDVQFTPILVNDLADILFAMLDRKLSGLYHIGGSEKVSKYEFARRIAAEFGFDPAQVVPARMEEIPLRARRAPDMSLNTDKISAALGRTMPRIGSGLRRFRELRDAGYPQRLKSYLNGAQK